ncbi:Hypothetical protein EIN_254310, partial [Entamoeba invadens IP1]
DKTTQKSVIFYFNTKCGASHLLKLISSPALEKKEEKTEKTASEDFADSDEKDFKDDEDSQKSSSDESVSNDSDDIGMATGHSETDKISGLNCRERDFFQKRSDRPLNFDSVLTNLPRFVAENEKFAVYKREKKKGNNVPTWFVLSTAVDFVSLRQTFPFESLYTQTTEEGSTTSTFDVNLLPLKTQIEAIRPKFVQHRIDFSMKRPNVFEFASIEEEMPLGLAIQFLAPRKRDIVCDIIEWAVLHNIQRVKSVCWELKNNQIGEIIFKIHNGQAQIIRTIQNAFNRFGFEQIKLDDIKIFCLEQTTKKQEVFMKFTLHKNAICAISLLKARSGIDSMLDNCMELHKVVLSYKKSHGSDTFENIDEVFTNFKKYTNSVSNPCLCELVKEVKISDGVADIANGFDMSLLIHYDNQNY